MAAGETLILEARDFEDPQHWRWVLKDSHGKFLADHEVDLDSGDSNYSAFIDLKSLPPFKSILKSIENNLGTKAEE